MQEELEGIRDDYLSHGKLAMMRRVRRYERAEDGPDNDKLLIRVKNDRNALKPRGQGEDRGPVYYEIDAIWDDWHTRMADARVQGLSSMPLPRPYAQIPRL